MASHRKNRLPARGNTPNERILWASLFAPGPNGRRGIPYVLVGQPGSSKTATARRLSKRAGLHFEGVISSLREPSDFLGLLMPRRVKLDASNQVLSPDGEEEVVLAGYAPASFAVRATLAGRALVLLDEVNTAPLSVQAALLRLLFEGVCGELEMPAGVRFMLAMNDIEDAAGGRSVAPALANRIGWLRWDSPAVSSFNAYLVGGASHSVAGAARQPIVAEVNPKDEEAAVDAAWPAAWAKAAGLVAGFLTSKGTMLHNKPKGREESARPWPSPRTWEFGTTAMAMGEVYDLADSEVATAVAAFIGDGAYKELRTWVKSVDLPPTEEFLDGKVPFKHDPKRLDRTAAVLSSAAAFLADKDAPSRLARADNLWTWLHDQLCDTAPDVALVAVSTMAQSRLIVGTKQGFRVMAKMEPYLAAVGITPESR